MRGCGLCRPTGTAGHRATGICSSSSAHRRFLEWVEAGVFEHFWREGLLKYEETKGIDWSWLSLDGAMCKAPLERF